MLLYYWTIIKTKGAFMYDNIIKTYELEHIRNKIKSIDITTKDRDTLLHIKLNMVLFPAPAGPSIATE